MKRRRSWLTMMGIVLLLSACGPINQDDSSSSVIEPSLGDSATSGPMSDQPSLDSSEPTPPISSDIVDDSSSITPSPTPTSYSISQLKEQASLISELDANGCGTGSYVVFSARYLAEVTDNNNKLMLMADATSMISVRTVDSIAKKYTPDNSYRITGQLTMYYHRPEVTLSSIEEISAITVDLSTLATTTTITGLYEDIKELKINNKGNAYGDLYCLDLQYIRKLENEILLFSDGTMTLQIHGDSKVSNGKSIGNTYRLYVVASMYLYKAGAEFIDHILLTTGTVDYEAIRQVARAQTATKISSTKREDENQQYFPYYLSFQGYVSADEQQASKMLLAFVDNLNDRVNGQSSGTTSKALYVKNHVLESSDDYGHSVLYPYFAHDSLVSAIFVVAGYNTSYHTWQVYCLDETVQAVS